MMRSWLYETQGQNIRGVELLGPLKVGAYVHTMTAPTTTAAAAAKFHQHTSK